MLSYLFTICMTTSCFWGQQENCLPKPCPAPNINQVTLLLDFSSYTILERSSILIQLINKDDHILESIGVDLLDNSFLNVNQIIDFSEYYPDFTGSSEPLPISIQISMEHSHQMITISDIIIDDVSTEPCACSSIFIISLLVDGKLLEAGSTSYRVIL